MSQIDLESFQRLEEFSSFTSCIRSFGRSIIPPLVIPDHVHELRQLRNAAINKEAEIQKRKNDRLKKTQNDHASIMLLEKDNKLDFQSNVQESCALWYPSYRDNQDVSIAISKFPTSGIYSSVHTGAIVCSNVIGSNHAYNTQLVKDVLYDSGTNVEDCVVCSHNNINLECSMCQAEFDQHFCNKSFIAELNPEVPCRTFSLQQHNDSTIEGELNTTVDETECESLPTVICNQKNVQPDTDSESSVTCMTQSTDLEKYMEVSCEFSSPENSAIIWDSKTSSQQYTLSRSDDASSETIVNTENELTPCASTMAELTDNIEDEFSNADEVAGATNNKEVTTGTMKRAHSVDSYMKILQTCARNLHVKKSQSEPFNTNKVSETSDTNDIKTSIISKTSLLIKEDSKESEEAKDIPEKDNCAQVNSDVPTKKNTVTESNNNNNTSFQKKHVRQNSYTLEHPSSALIKSHANCTCNFDVKCTSPHCSALKNTNQIVSNSAFVKERVDIPTSYPQVKMLPILHPEDLSKSSLNKEELSSTVVDIFPNVKEDSCEKSNSGNTKVISIAYTFNTKNDSGLDSEEYLSKSFVENFNLSNPEKHQDYIQRICEELKANHETRVKELREEQSRQWLKLEEEFKEQEKLLYEKLKISLETRKSVSSKSEEDQIKSNMSCNSDKISDDKTVSHKELTAPKSPVSLFDQVPTSDGSSFMQNSPLSIANENSPSFPPPQVSVLDNVRASSSPSKEYQSSDNNPSKPLEANKTISNVSPTSLKNNETTVYSNTESMSNVNGISHPSSFVPDFNSLPKYPSAIAVPICNDHDKVDTGFCDNTCELCRGSFSSCSEYDMNTSLPCYMLSSREQNGEPFDNNTNNLSDNVAFKSLSFCKEVQNQTLDSAEFNYSKKSDSNSSEKSKDHVSTMQNDMLINLENEKMAVAKQDNKDKSNNLSVSMQEKTMSHIDNLVSLYAKTPMNGACISHHISLSNKTNSDFFLMKKFEKLPSFVKGYLTRRLLNTEYVQNLIKTLKDTALLIGKMREDLPAKGNSLSQGDEDFQRQLIVLLMTTYDNLYDTFFTISTQERMKIIADSRNLKLKQKTLDQESEPNPPASIKTSEPSTCRPSKLTSATLKALERKKRYTIDSRTYSVEDFRKARSRSVLEMRTYTIDDLPNFRGRAQSSMSSKNASVSPASVYKNSIGTSLKRKTASTKSSGSRGCVHHKWVP